jgi:hypothetical protein
MFTVSHTPFFMMQAWQEKKSKMKQGPGINIRVTPVCLISTVVVVAVWNIWGSSLIYSKDDFVATETQLWRQTSVATQDWTNEDVDVWLALTVRLDPQYRRAFRSKRVDGKLLLGLSDKDIRDELRIEDNLSVKRILLHLEDLKTGKGLPPSLAGQVLLRNAEMGNSSDFSMRMDVSNTMPRVLHLYR